ncbi:hypothetical protein KL910_002584 [Ogataea haglerorum]|nr:hypothetical protein KL945_004682 [Ogataea haglerorum]KAG7789878.1 hypothetical protein KL910_002584 [Ogataea haglerorum]
MVRPAFVDGEQQSPQEPEQQPRERRGRREHDQFPNGRDYEPEHHQPHYTPEQSECLCAAVLRNKVAEPDGENRRYRKVQGLAVRHVQQSCEHAGPPHYPGHEEHALQDERVLHAINVEIRRVLLQQHAEGVETEQQKVGKMKDHREHRKPEPVRIRIPDIVLVAQKLHMVDGYQEHQHHAGHKPAGHGNYLSIAVAHFSSVVQQETNIRHHPAHHRDRVHRVAPALVGARRLARDLVLFPLANHGCYRKQVRQRADTAANQREVRRKHEPDQKRRLPRPHLQVCHVPVGVVEQAVVVLLYLGGHAFERSRLLHGALRQRPENGVDKFVLLERFPCTLVSAHSAGNL